MSRAAGDGRPLKVAMIDIDHFKAVNYTYTHQVGDSVLRPKASAHLLPNYDEFFIGYRNRSAIGMRLKSVKAVTGGNALIAHVVAMDGQLVGGWRRTVEGDGVTLQLKLLTRLSPPEQKRLLGEVRRYAAFAGMPVELRGLDVKRRVAPR